MPSNSRSLSTTSLCLTLFGMATAWIIAPLIYLGFIPIPYDSILVPLLILLILVPYCIVGTVISIVSYCRTADIKSFIAMGIGSIAFISALGLVVLAGMVGLANHPI